MCVWGGGGGGGGGGGKERGPWPMTGEGKGVVLLARTLCIFRERWQVFRPFHCIQDPWQYICYDVFPSFFSPPPLATVIAKRSDAFCTHPSAMERQVPSSVVLMTTSMSTPGRNGRSCVRRATHGSEAM